MNFFFSQMEEVTSDEALSWAFTKGVSSKTKYKSYAKNSYTKGVTFQKWCKHFHEKVYA